MATAAPNNMRRLKGKLVGSKDSEDASDFDLTAAYPYGGVELGLCRSAAFVWGIRYAPIQSEEFGGIATEFMYLSQQAVLSAVLREYDDDMVRILFHGVTDGMNQSTGAKGTVSGKPVIKGGQAIGLSPGQVSTTRHRSLLFVPDDADNHEFLLLYNVMPMAQEGSDMKLTAADWAEIGVVFQAVPNSAGKIYEFGRITDIPV